MRLGIVGHEAAKFTPDTESVARSAIRGAIERLHPSIVISGQCHLGGIDIWAVEEARGMGVETREHPPKYRRWRPEGYEERNLKIARESDLVLCIVVRELPPDYRGMTFDGCYHCRGRVPTHVKSGGCWTAWRCKGRAWQIIATHDDSPFVDPAEEALKRAS